jgi:uncharacterized protein
MSFWKNKVVVVTGGSKGLGLEIARQLVAAESRVFLIARDAELLNKVANELAVGATFRPQVVVADLVNSEQASAALQSIVQEAQQIDVLFNVVGESIRCRLSEATPEIFRQQMDVNFFSAVNCTQAALNSLRQSQGRIVNIASLAAKTPWPLVGPYVTSKAALAAYTDQLRLEIKELSTVLLVCPGPILRDDAGTRYKSQTTGLNSVANQPGAGAKLKGLNPQSLAKMIINATVQGKRELIIPWRAGVLFKIAAIFPRLGDWLRKKFNSNSQDN